MKVKTVKPFFDKKAGVTRLTGDSFAVTEERYKELIESRFGVLVEAVAEETAKPKKKPTKRGD